MKLNLPITVPFAPMEAKRVEKIPEGSQWQYEPKWDGFRALTFKEGKKVFLQSKSGQDLGRYFPEIIKNLEGLPNKKLVLDGELVLFKNKKISFDDLQLRLHPAQSRILRLSKESPATYMVFDLLIEDAKNLLNLPLAERRKALTRWYKKILKKADSMLKLSPYSCDLKEAQDWFENGLEMGLDGIMAKDANASYHSGDREAMVKVKHLKDADCVIAGFRVQDKKDSIAALTLGLYDDEGILHHVGSTSSFNAEDRKKIFKKLQPIAGIGGFTGRSPGHSRWSKKENEWIPVKPKYVAEVRYDYFSQGRFRHGAKFLRWRRDKTPQQCRFDQLQR